MKNQTIPIVASIIAIFGFLSLVYIYTNKPSNVINAEVNQIKSTDRVKWSKNSKNILVEYSDFFCPACKILHDYLKQYESTESANFNISQKTAFVYRHFPIHDSSYDASYVAEAAGKQNKYYEMIDLIFANQENLSNSKNLKDDLVKLALELNIDIEKFKKDIDSQEVKDKVQEDQRSGEKAGINATPTFFLNGKKLEFQTTDDLQNLLQSS